jgi:hypothetical protein
LLLILGPLSEILKRVVDGKELLKTTLAREEFIKGPAIIEEMIRAIEYVPVVLHGLANLVRGIDFQCGRKMAFKLVDAAMLDDVERVPIVEEVS